MTYTSHIIPKSINSNQLFTELRSPNFYPTRSRAITTQVPRTAASVILGSPGFFSTMQEILAEKVLTHGFVHGHIHKHKDHTHIHGHIHNHDHDHHHGLDEAADKVELCPESEELALCDEIFCNELDDCLFTNCQDTRDQCLQHECYDETAYSTYDCTSCCEDPNCDSTNSVCPSLVCKDPACSGEHQDHENNLCDLQLSKRPIFENLINNVHSGICEEQPRKKLRSDPLKVPKLQLHFPHECHPAPEQNASTKCDSDAKPCSVNHHHIHQSCFHTTIPNPPIGSEDPVMSDFDFYVQFNNFNETLKSLSDISYPEYLCEWENCHKTVTNQTFLQHLLENHIGQEYSRSDVKSEAPYHCEWNYCNFMDSDLNSLINHVNVHKKHSETNKNNVLTPSSSELSANSSPLENTTTDHHLDIRPVGQASNYNITAMEIRPTDAHLRCNHVEDPTFTCKWETHTENGVPVPCGKSHGSAAELHNHLLEEHLKSGQKLYDCCWIGCERHNGKNFRQRQKLVRHLFIHTKHRPCVCDICGARFAVANMLKQHMRTHSGEKPYACNVCGKQFSTSSSLSIHNRVHTGEKPLMCKWPGCGKRFRESSNLTKHMKVHYKSNKPEDAAFLPIEGAITAG